MKRIRKKGQMDDWADLVIAIVFLLLVFMFVSIFADIKRTAEMDLVNDKLAQFDGFSDMMTFLRMPVEDTTIADMIIDTYSNEGKWTEIDKKAQEFFGLTKDRDWQIVFSEVRPDGSHNYVGKHHIKPAGSDCQDIGPSSSETTSTEIGKIDIPLLRDTLDKKDGMIALRFTLYQCSLGSMFVGAGA